jgi:hypothetical protein
MSKNVGWLSVIGLLGLVAAAHAQTPPHSAATTQFDGTYRLVSSANVNPTFMTRRAEVGQCPQRRPGPLHIVNGHARYTSATGYRVTGTVGPQGELAMRAIGPSAGSQPIELSVIGSVGSAGTARVRQRSYSCSYDFVWQKVAR